MKIRIEHEIPGRLRFSTSLGTLTIEQADQLQYYLLSLPDVTGVKVYERSGNAVVFYQGSRKRLIKGILAFAVDTPEVQSLVPEHTSRALNHTYYNKIFDHVGKYWLYRLLLPKPLRMCRACFQGFRYIREGIRCLMHRKLEVAVLDATAIAVSMARGQFSTASSVMFLLGLGELMEEWTHKKSVADLASSMSLNVEKVWRRTGETDELVSIREIVPGDHVRVEMGNMIPLDGIVVEGEAMVNQASLTGESVPVRKEQDSMVYAGTVVEEGALTLCVKQAVGETRYEKIVHMIEDSERLKSSMESSAAHLADRLVPYSFLGAGLAWLVTRNVQKAISVLMVDFSCALKLSMPVAVLSAMRECNDYKITVKGGKFLEAIANADTIVFDKTGTLTLAQPSVREVIPFGGNDRDEMLRTAACLEEHFPHSIANAVVRQAEIEGLLHAEEHAKVKYIIAHGIASELRGEHVCIGSYHFIFEDENCEFPEEEREKFENLPDECSHLYMSIGGKLAAILCIEDPLRPEGVAVVQALKELGITKTVMMTGDSERTAAVIARKVGVDEYHAEVLPEDKASFVQRERERGRTVIMIGDGINDSPALSAADVGIAVSEGAQIAREIADVTISGRDLYQLVTLKRISIELMKRIGFNYRFVIGFNSGLLALGLLGVITPNVSAFLHNMSTLGIGVHGTTNLLPPGGGMITQG